MSNFFWKIDSCLVLDKKNIEFKIWHLHIFYIQNVYTKRNYYFSNYLPPVRVFNKGYNVFSVSIRTILPPVYPFAPGSCAVTENTQKYKKRENFIT